MYRWVASCMPVGTSTRANAPCSSARGGLGGSSPRMSQPLGAEPADLGVNEFVDLAVHHRGGVPGLEAGPQVLDVLVRVQNVVADLGTPASGVVPAQLGHFGLLLRALALEQLGLQHGHS